MKDNIVIHSMNNNAYLYNREEKILTFIPPSMEIILNGSEPTDPIEKEYYDQKISFLKKHLGEINKETKSIELLSDNFRIPAPVNEITIPRQILLIIQDWKP